MISISGIVNSVATMYVDGLWKVALMFSIFGVVLIAVSFLNVWTKRQSNRKFDSGAGLFAVGALFHLIYLWSIGYSQHKHR